MIKPFQYITPSNLTEACLLLEKYDGNARIIAGGQSLLILLKQRLIDLEYLIDIRNIPGLNFIHYDERDGLKIGATTTHRLVEISPLIKEKFPVLSDMEKRLSAVQIRNWGTLGGNLCHADPSGDPAPPLIALGAKAKIMSVKGEKLVFLEDFFVDYYETILKSEEILCEIQIPNPPQNFGCHYYKYSLREVDPPIVGVAVSITLDDSKKYCADSKIVLGAVAPKPIRIKRAEEFLLRKHLEDDVIMEAAKIASEESQPIPDIHASEEYKREMVKVWTKRVAKMALEFAKAN